MTTLYNLHTDGDQYRITKFRDGDVEASYLCTEEECECPAGHRASCRHRQMVPEMVARGLVDSHWFWNFDRHEAVDINGASKAMFDNLNQLANIPGIQVLDLNDIVGVHNTIAEAVGEPLIEGANRTATEIANTPMPELKEPLIEHLVNQVHETTLNFGDINHDAPNRTVLGTPKAAWRRL
jgi:hypothetical protein